MAVTNGLQSKSIKKYVLQQSNCNLDVSHERDEDQKPLLEKSMFGLKGKESALETENQRSPHQRGTAAAVTTEKPIKSEAKKLRSVRLELSSLKRGAGQKGSSRVNEFGGSSTEGESSDEDVKIKRKPRPVVPNYVTNTESGPCRKPRQSRQQDALLLSSQMSPKSSSQSLSIARRNARERNRVKQVNEGFATLRSRIPDYISEAYNEEKGRKSAKKLSKVETLRMAVDYIRHLETLLDLKSTEGGWTKEVKTEERPWETPSSGGYLSPRYQGPCGESPYDQGFEYQDRIFYEYELEFGARKGPEKKEAPFPVLGIESENQCVEDEFKYYETFNRIKKDGGGGGGGEREGPETGEGSPPGDEDDDDDDVDEGAHHLLPKDVIRKAPKKGVLPPITESFNKTIPVFF